MEAQKDDSSDARNTNRPDEEEGPLDIIHNQHDGDESEREGNSGKDVCWIVSASIVIDEWRKRREQDSQAPNFCTDVTVRDR